MAEVTDIIEVLVATMHQHDCSLYNKMNIKTDALIANQGDEEFSINNNVDGHSVRMISTTERGVSKNRNLALKNAKGTICMLCDDDLIYQSEYPKIVKAAFNELSRADVIIFNVYKKDGNPRTINSKIKRIRSYNFGAYGSVSIAFRKESILNSSISFCERIGPGTNFGSGEDNLFIRDVLRKGLKVYTYPKEIARLIPSKSTWFVGYDEKHFYDKGVAFALLFPVFKYIITIPFAILFSLRKKINVLFVLKNMFKGIHAQKRWLPYN